MRNLVSFTRFKKRVNDTKFLRVTIDENLNWTTHIETISKKYIRGVGIINKLQHFVPEGVLYSLFCTLTLPYINYGIIAWGSLNKLNMDRIMKLQKKAVRIMSNSHYLNHLALLLKKYNLLNVCDIYLLEVCTFMYKEFNNKLPDIFHKYFNQQKACIRIKHVMLQTMRFLILKQILPGKQLELQGQ